MKACIQCAFGNTEFHWCCIYCLSMSLICLCRLLTVLSDTALHQKLSSADVSTFHLSLLPPSFQFVGVQNTLKHKDVGDRLLLVFAVLHPEPLFSPRCWRPIACPSPAYLGELVLPGEVCMAALLSLLLGWVGNAKHVLF